LKPQALFLRPCGADFRDTSLSPPLADTVNFHHASHHGKVVSGKIEVPGEDLAEGTVVTILAPEDRETFRLEPDLLLAIEEADRGELVSGDELLRRIR
jgi:hypothetical protein